MEARSRPARVDAGDARPMRLLARGPLGRCCSSRRSLALLLAARGGSYGMARSDGTGSSGAARWAGAAPGGTHRTTDASALGDASAGPVVEVAARKRRET
jgi:hypothetical protein